ncbi:MAG: endonuclease/exonuclease/phosphatase family protein [Candidatus Bathyarchaeota archaeon]|jgi:hypothetical protein
MRTGKQRTTTTSNLQEVLPFSQKIRIGTYNTNNLFDRFDDPYYTSDDPWRSFYSTRPKTLKEMYNLGARIRSSDVDILALQEIENLGTLHDFIHGQVGPFYKLNGVISLESNDPRGIDLAAVTRFRLGRVISHRFRRYNGKRVFSRDCLQLEVMHPNRSEVLLTLFICHLKSKYSKYPVGTPEHDRDQQRSLEKRKRQVEHTIQIVKSCQDINNDRFAILGDMNDTPDSPALQGFLRSNNPLKLKEALKSIPQRDTAPNSPRRRPRDTHKWKKDEAKGHMQTTYSQLDYILLSKTLANAFTGLAKVEQRRFTQGSDHYLCWTEFNIALL